MHEFPATPRAENAPAGLFEQGHLWLLERVDGEPLRFSLAESGGLRFGDRERVWSPDDVPPRYQHAVRHVRENLDRAALRDAASDVAQVCFLGVATQKQRIDYDWQRLPSYLGVDVWSGASESFLPPDRARQVYESLGLEPVTVLAQEVRASDLDPTDYELPESAWYDGPAAGALVRNKTGQRAVIPRSDLDDAPGTGDAPGDSESSGASAAALAGEYAPDERFERVARAMEESGQRVAFDGLFERVRADVLREHHRTLADESNGVDRSAFRSELAALTREFLDGW